MIVSDANLLLYSYDSASPFHERAVGWWQECLSGSETFGLCGVVLSAFLRSGTNRRDFVSPMSVEEATGHTREWLALSVTDFLVTQESDVVQALNWLEAAGSGGNLTTDVHIAAIANRHRAMVHTADTNFGRFSGVRWLNPLL